MSAPLVDMTSVQVGGGGVTLSDAHDGNIEAASQEPQQQHGTSSAKQSRHWWLVRKARQHYQSTIAQVPPKYKWLCLIAWVTWKFVAVYLVYSLISPSTSSSKIQWVPSIVTTTTTTTMQQEKTNHRSNSAAVRVLYIVTSTIPATVEENNSVLYEALPVLRHNVATILEQRFHVDVVWILESEPGNNGHIDIQSILDLSRNSFPPQVQLSIWPRANSLVSDPETGRLVQHHSQQQQAWWVIRDRYPLYHVFMVWPDTARILGSHLLHFWKVSQHIFHQQKQWKDGDLEQYIPGLVPVMPHANVDRANTSSSKDEKTDHQWNTQSRTTLSTVGMTLGPMIKMAIHSNGTNSETLHLEPTAILPQAPLHSQNGFIVTRSQLANHGLLECLLPQLNDAIPITQSFQNLTKLSTRHACLMPGPTLLLAKDLEKHVVQFLHPHQLLGGHLHLAPSQSRTEVKSVDWDTFVQRVEELVQKSSIHTNGQGKL